MALGSSVTGRGLNRLVYDGYMKAISKSWLFFLGALLITRRSSFSRHLGKPPPPPSFCQHACVTWCAGLGVTTLYSLYLAIFSHYLPWTNYFNIFSNLLYITASWNSAGEAASIHDFIGTPSSSTPGLDRQRKGYTWL